MSESFVFFEDQKIGELFEVGSGSIGFRYEKSWMKTGFEISHSLPFREKKFEAEANAYFANFLPEGDVRASVASRLGISIDNDFRLLVALGGECAGALTVGDEPRPLESRYEKIDTKALGKRFEHGETLLATVQDEGEGIRFSLAGAQDKIAVGFDGKSLLIPHGNSPSTHILKPPSRRFPHVPEAECLMNRFALAMGLETATTTMMKLGNVSACLVERFDRIDSGGKIRRLHQEDFCQALGISHKKKYERDGGPSFSMAVECTERISVRLPDDVERLIRWLVFNVLIGNCDAHAKNLSLLRESDGNWRLSPHYDFIPTRVYPKVSKNLAMAIGDTRDSGTITGTHWKKLSRDVKFGYPLLTRMIEEMSEIAVDTFDGVADTFERAYGPAPIAQPIRKVIHEQSRRLLSQLKK